MNKEELTTQLLLTKIPEGWRKNWGDYSRIGMILDNYSITEKIKYLNKNAYFETTLNNFLDQQITEFIINKEKENRNGK